MALCTLSLNSLLPRLPPTAAFLGYLVAWLGWTFTTQGLWHGAAPLTCGFVITLHGWRLLALL
jgi:hypothetical protein